MEHDVWGHSGSGGEVALPGGGEVPAALAACRAALRSPGGLTLAVAAASGTGSGEGFLGWVERDFRRWHAPQVARAFSAAASSGVAELVAADSEFAAVADRVFGPEVLTASLARGAAVLGTLTGARHARVGERLRAAVEAGECPGHVATAFGCHCAEMHIPLAEALLGFAVLEHEAAASARAGGRGGLLGAGAGAAPHPDRLSGTGAEAEAGTGVAGAVWAGALQRAVAEVTRSYGGGSDQFVACA